MADNMDQVKREDEEKECKLDRHYYAFIVAAIVLMITAWLTLVFPDGFGTALIAALVIAAMDWIIQRVFKIDASPFGRGIVGFIVSAVIIYLTQFWCRHEYIHMGGNYSVHYYRHNRCNSPDKC